MFTRWPWIHNLKCFVKPSTLLCFNLSNVRHWLLEIEPDYLDLQETWMKSRLHIGVRYMTWWYIRHKIRHSIRWVYLAPSTSLCCTGLAQSDSWTIRVFGSFNNELMQSCFVWRVIVIVIGVSIGICIIGVGISVCIQLSQWQLWS